MRKILFSVISVGLLSFTALLPLKPISAEEDKQISAKALDDHECDDSEWHFVITQIDSEANAPDHILVYWVGVPDPLSVPISSFTGGTAHYATTMNLEKAVSEATAEIYISWDGQFNLSHGPCDPGPESATYTIETLCWEPGRKNATFTVFHVTLTIEGPTGSFEIGQLNTGEFEIDEDVTLELEPGEYTFSAQADEGYELEGEPDGQFTIERCPVNGNGDEGFGGENFLQNAILAAVISAAVMFTLLLLIILRRDPA